jgi:hypothetical protein
MVAGIRPETEANLKAIKPDLDHLALVLRAEMPRVNRVVPVLVQVIHEATQKPAAAPAKAPAAPAYDSKGAVKARRFF